jgi:DNA end-binding protein Ku
VARAIWKGAISFALVHVPVSLYPAVQDSGIDFDWLDRRSLDPVGYKRYNKRSGRELKPQDIVKGVRQPNGEYVVLSDEEVKAAFPKSTQSIEIDSFVKAQELPPTMFERPYFVEPAGKAEKVYALLRDAMLEAGVIAIASIVMHNKEHLVALVPSGRVLMLNTMRWTSEMRAPTGLKFPGQGLPAVAIKPGERQMAARLIAEMSSPWKADRHSEHFSTAIRALVRRKVAAGQAKEVRPLEEAPAEQRPSNVIDLTELLAKSLSGKARPNPAHKKGGAAASGTRGRKPAAQHRTTARTG